MHGERYDFTKVSRPGPTKNCKLSTLGFMYEQDVNEDMTLAIAQLMNLFPLKAAGPKGLSDVKFDVLVSDGFSAYAVKSGDTYWILLSEYLLRRSLTIADHIVSEYLERGFGAAGHLGKDMKRLVFYMLMEFIIQHELGHIRSGHVDYLGTTLGIGLTDLSALADELANEIGLAPSGTPAMEFIADEAAIGTCVIGSVVGRWNVVPHKTNEVFEMDRIFDAIAITMICFMLCVPEDRSVSHPSALARFIRLGDLYRVYLSQSEQPQQGIPSVVRGFCEKQFQRFRDILFLVKEAVTRQRIDLDPAARVLILNMFDQTSHGGAYLEIDSTIQQIKSSLQAWQGYKCQIVPWSTQ